MEWMQGPLLSQHGGPREQNEDSDSIFTDKDENVNDDVVDSDDNDNCG